MCVCRRNILDTQNESYLKTCRYNSRSDIDRLCPIFVLGDIVTETQTSPNQSYSSIALLVRVIAGLSSRVVSASDCGVRGSRFESRR